MMILVKHTQFLRGRFNRYVRVHCIEVRRKINKPNNKLKALMVPLVTIDTFFIRS